MTSPANMGRLTSQRPGCAFIFCFSTRAGYGDTSFFRQSGGGTILASQYLNYTILRPAGLTLESPAPKQNGFPANRVYLLAIGKTARRLAWYR